MFRCLSINVPFWFILTAVIALCLPKQASVSSKKSLASCKLPAQHRAAECSGVDKKKNKVNKYFPEAGKKQNHRKVNENAGKGPDFMFKSGVHN